MKYSGIPECETRIPSHDKLGGFLLISFNDDSATDNDKDAIDELRYYYGKSTR